MQSPFGDAKPREAIIASRVGKTEEEVLKEEVQKEKLHVSGAAAAAAHREREQGGGAGRGGAGRCAGSATQRHPALRCERLRRSSAPSRANHP